MHRSGADFRSTRSVLSQGNSFRNEFDRSQLAQISAHGMARNSFTEQVRPFPTGADFHPRSFPPAQLSAPAPWIVRGDSEVCERCAATTRTGAVSRLWRLVASVVAGR